MNKFIKCWVFIICLLFILLILFTDRVKADTWYVWNMGYNPNTRIATLNEDVKYYTFNLSTNKIIPDGMEYLTFTAGGMMLNTSYSYGINLNETCNNTNYTTQPYLATHLTQKYVLPVPIRPVTIKTPKGSLSFFTPLRKKDLTSI